MPVPAVVPTTFVAMRHLAQGLLSVPEISISSVVFPSTNIFCCSVVKSLQIKKPSQWSPVGIALNLIFSSIGCEISYPSLLNITSIVSALTDLVVSSKRAQSLSCENCRLFCVAISHPKTLSFTPSDPSSAAKAARGTTAPKSSRHAIHRTDRKSVNLFTVLFCPTLLIFHSLLENFY